MNIAAHRLVYVPPIKFLTAPQGMKERCPRCRKVLEGTLYVEHSEGKVHRQCLRVGQSRKFVGRELCQR